MALQCSPFLAEEVEARQHRLVVGDTLVVVALHDAYQLFGHPDFLLLDNLIVADNAERHIRRHNGELVDFVVGEELEKKMKCKKIRMLLRHTIT